MSHPAFVLVTLLALSAPLTAVGQQPPAGALPKNGSAKLLDAINYARTGKRLLAGARIVGGKVAAPGTHPWQVALVAAEGKVVADAFFCGGSLYSANWVITAAHCVNQGTTASQVDVVVGTQDLRKGGTRLKVAQIIIHKAYGVGNPNDNDVALLKLASNVPAAGTKAIVPVSEAEESTLIPPQTLVTTSGWGATSQGGNVVPDLRELTIPTVPTKGVCDDKVSYGNRVTDNMICAGRQQGGQDSCQGDSGGPLSAGTGEARRLVGIVSWGDGCAQPDKYGIYTRVARYSQWIRDNAK
jgi:secreted trypsin-like serine protease